MIRVTSRIIVIIVSMYCLVNSLVEVIWLGGESWGLQQVSARRGKYTMYFFVFVVVVGVREET